jgi:hypothetical protein
MTERTTRAQVDAKLETLNDVSKCAYELDGAYGGWHIVRMDAPGTGEHELLRGPRLSLGGIYYVLDAMLTYRDAELGDIHNRGYTDEETRQRAIKKYSGLFPNIPQQTIITALRKISWSGPWSYGEVWHYLNVNKFLCSCLFSSDQACPCSYCPKRPNSNLCDKCGKERQ